MTPPCAKIYPWALEEWNVGLINESQYPIIDDLVKSLKTVTPAEAGVQNYFNLLDSRFRENDKIGEITTFSETLILPFFQHSNSPFLGEAICRGRTTDQGILKKIWNGKGLVRIPLTSILNL